MAPDVLKLARAVEDALSGVCYSDDALIVEEALRKVWADEWGVLVTIEEIEAERDDQLALAGTDQRA